MSSQQTTPETAVIVRCTGNVRDAVGTYEAPFRFEGRTLRAFLDAFFDEYDVADLIIAAPDEESARGWVKAPASVPGQWRANPSGENTKPFARVTVNGRFNEHLDGLDTVLENGDRVALMKPFIFCC